MSRRITFAVLAAAALSACSEEQRITGPLALSADEHTDKFSCPSRGTPPPGSRVRGDLEVDGTCILDRVTIDGDITIIAGGSLQAQSITVNSGISV